MSEKETEITIRPYRILFFDPWLFRHDKFFVKAKDLASKFYPQVTRCLNCFELLKVLRAVKAGTKDRPDVLFFPSYMTDGGSHRLQRRVREKLVEALIELPTEKRPRLVVYHGHKDDHGILPRLDKEGFNVVHQSWADKQQKRIR